MATQPPPEAVCVSVQGKIFQSAACWASLQLGCASILKTSMHHCSCTQQDFGVWSLLGPSLPPHTSVLPLKELVILGCVCPTGTAPLELSIFERGWKVGGHSPENFLSLMQTWLNSKTSHFKADLSNITISNLKICPTEQTATTTLACSNEVTVLVSPIHSYITYIVLEHSELTFWSLHKIIMSLPRVRWSPNGTRRTD